MITNPFVDEDESDLIKEECCDEKEAANDRPTEKEDIPEPEQKIDLLVDDVLIKRLMKMILSLFSYLSEDTESIA